MFLLIVFAFHEYEEWDFGVGSPVDVQLQNLSVNISSFPKVQIFPFSWPLIQGRCPQFT